MTPQQTRLEMREAMTLFVGVVDNLLDALRGSNEAATAPAIVADVLEASKTLAAYCRALEARVVVLERKI